MHVKIGLIALVPCIIIHLHMLCNREYSMSSDNSPAQGGVSMGKGRSGHFWCVRKIQPLMGNFLKHMGIAVGFINSDVPLSNPALVGSG